MTCSELGSRKTLPAVVWTTVHSNRDQLGGSGSNLEERQWWPVNRAEAMGVEKGGWNEEIVRVELIALGLG